VKATASAIGALWGRAVNAFVARANRRWAVPSWRSLLYRSPSLLQLQGPFLGQDASFLHIVVIALPAGIFFGSTIATFRVGVSWINALNVLLISVEACYQNTGVTSVALTMFKPKKTRDLSVHHCTGVEAVMLPAFVVYLLEIGLDKAPTKR
jgi:hypothetical protein